VNRSAAEALAQANEQLEGAQSSAHVETSVRPRTSHTVSFLITLATNFGMMTVTVGTGIAEARLLGPRGLGELAAIQLVPMVVGSFGLLGIPNATGYFCAREPRAARRICATGIAIGLAVACLTIPVSHLLLPRLMPRQDASVVAMSRIYLAFIPLQVVAGIPLWAIYGCNRFRLWNALRLLPTFAWVGALVTTIAAHRATPIFVASAFLAFYAFTVPVNMIALYRVTQPADRGAPHAQSMLRYGLPVMLGTIPTLLNARLDQMLMVALVPAEALGLYGTASSWANGLAPVLMAVGSVLFPAMASSEDPARRRDILQRCLRVAVLMAAVLGTGLAVITPIAYPLIFGERFASAVKASIVLIICGGVSSLSGVIEESLRGLGAPRWPLYAQLAALPATVGLMVLLLPLYGATGAALSALAASVLVFAILTVGVIRVAGIGKEAFLPRKSDLTAIYEIARGALKRGRA
jgi:O-antigen/teichoic acid export membrane protein